MATKKTTNTIEVDTLNEIAKIQKEDKRPSFSNTMQILLQEAIEARKKKKK
jgi:hypothetical protein